MAYTGNQGFGGLDARRAASDGAIRDMDNMSLRFSPALSSRTKRRKIGDGWSDFGGVHYGDRTFVCRGGKLYDGDDEVCDVSPGEKQMAVLENNLYVFPDKIRYNTADKTLKDFNVTVSNEGNYYGSVFIDYYQTRTENGDFIETVYHAAGIGFKTTVFDSIPFKAGERLKIKVTRRRKWQAGSFVNVEFEKEVVPEAVNYESGNATYGACYVMRLPLDTFDELAYKNELTGQKELYKPLEVEVEVSYPIPDVDGIFASDNRLWGFKGREIYASALGDGMNWTDYDTLTTSSWAATTKTGDEITAGVDFGGMPVFFCENAAYKIYGENPKEFQYARQDMIGVTKGDHKSVAVGAGYIFYATRRGIYAWTGGVPQIISSPLGDGRIKEAVGGSDGTSYYLSCVQDGRQNLYVYDPQAFVWVREDSTKALDIRQRGRDLCMVTEGGEVWLIGDVYGTEGTAEDGIRYSMETADYNDGAVTVKAAKHILLQHELTGGVADVCVSYDGEPYEHVYTLYDTDGKKITSVIPLREKRYRTMRIRIDGDGEIVIYYMVREVSALTERTGGEKNVY